MSYVERLRARLHARNPLLRGAIGEFFGTFLLVFIGECIVAQFHLLNHRNSWIQINVGWGFAVAFSVLAVAKVSGGHINPAVTAMLWSFGLVPHVQAAVYCLAQVLGGFVGAAATNLFYKELIDQMEVDHGRTVTGQFATAGIFTTFGPENLSAPTIFIDQAVGTGILCLFIAAIIDKRNQVPQHMHALLFGFVIMMIGCAFGQHIGYPINPARDFGPRLFAAIIYGGEVFTTPYWYYFLLPILGPIVGGIAAGWMYYLFAGYHIPDEEEHGNRQHHKLGGNEKGGSGGAEEGLLSQ